MKKILLVTGVSLFLSACTTLPCPRLPKSSAEGFEPLQPGLYEIALSATRGSQRGAVATGELVLLPTRADDRSPTTGRGPWEDEDRAKTPLYGWIEIDLDAVGAPMCSDDESRPDSRDPITPGVLVEQRRVTTLRVGTGGQTRNPTIGVEKNGIIALSVSLDGCGIRLRVNRVNAQGFNGRWSKAGIVRNGRGKFCARRVGDPPLGEPMTRVIKTQNFTVYEHNEVAIWFSPWFELGFTVANDAMDEAKDSYRENLAEIGTLFQRGLVSGRQLFELADLTVSPFAPDPRYDFPWQTYSEPWKAIAAHSGPIVKILHVKRLSASNDGKRRTYDLWVTFNKNETGWGSFHHFTLTVSNNRAGPATSAAEFASGAEIELLEYSGIEI